jgi:WD40 repeat protein
VAFSADGTQLTTMDFSETRVGDIRSYEKATLQVRAGEADTLAYTPNGSQLMLAGRETLYLPDNIRYLGSKGLVRLWDIATGKELRQPNVSGNFLFPQIFNPQGKQIFIAGYTSNNDVWHIGDVLADREVGKLSLGPKEGQLMALSQDGKQAVTSGETVTIWDVTAGKKTGEYKSGGVKSVVFSPDGKQLVITTEGTAVTILELASLRNTLTLTNHQDSVWQAAYSPDGQRLATASSDNTARIWNAKTGDALAILRGHTAEVYSVAFSPDGKRIVTNSADRTIRLWDVASGNELTSLPTFPVFTPIVFSADGKQIAVGDRDGAVRIYLTELDDLLALAQARVTRTLTCDERVIYLHKNETCPIPTPKPKG